MPRPFDTTPLSDEQRELAARHVGVAYAHARGFDPEAVGDALLALCVAARNYPGEHVCPFSAYAHNRIRTAVVRGARLWRRRGRGPEAGVGPAIDPDVEPDPTTILDREPAPGAGLESSEAVEAILGPLSPRQRDALWLVAVEEYTLAEAGARLGCGHPHAHRLVAAGRRRAGETLGLPVPDLRQRRRSRIPTGPGA